MGFVSVPAIGGDVENMSGYDTGVRGSQPPYTGAASGSTQGDGGTDGFGDAARGGDQFNAIAIAVDPQLTGPVQHELRGPHVSALQGAVRVPELVRFRDPRPPVPRPPRSLVPAAVLLTIAGVLLVVSIVAGIAAGPAVFGILAVLGLGTGGVGLAARHAARDGRPAILGGLLWLPETADLTGYEVANAGRLFHRRYAQPRVDLDDAALTTWQRAVDAANRVYRSQSLRDRAVDADRVTVEVPEQLWRIAEGLAKISDARFDLRRIAPETDRSHPAVESKVRDQERLLARGIGAVDRRIGRLETLAARLDAADAARQGEAVLRELVQVDPKIRDVLASTDSSTSDSELAASVQLDVEAVIAMANQAIRELSISDDHPVTGGPA
jgi:hypothetical protein